MPVDDPIDVMIVDDESMARQRIARLLAPEPGIRVAAECASAAEAIEALRTAHYDAAFVDVEMPELDGFGMLRSLPPSQVPLVVLVTAWERYALQAFEISAIDYLLKPFRRERFQETLGRLRQQVALRRQHGHAGAAPIAVGEGSGKTLLHPDEIDWIEAAGNYVCIHRGGATHVTRATLASLEARLRGTSVVRIHRSAMVNWNRVRSVGPPSSGDRRLTLSSGTTLTMSRTYEAALRTRLSC